MRANRHPRVRIALLSLCGVSIAAALISFCLAFTVESPSRSLRPLLPNVDAMYSPVYISMTAAGLLILAAVVAIVSCLHGNRVLDLICCVAMLIVAVLSVTSLGLVSALKGGMETSLEATLADTLRGYGPGNVSIYKAWNDMQTDLRCCGVRTNLAMTAYQMTPWYWAMRQGNPHTAPQIPNSCCSPQATGSQLTDCTTTKPPVPAQNALMNPMGCFETVRQMTDAFTVRYIILSVLLLMTSVAVLIAGSHRLVLLARTDHLADDRKSSLSDKKQLESAYANPAASIGLSRSSLASSSLHSVGGGRVSHAPSVYGGSSSRHEGSQRSVSSRPSSVIGDVRSLDGNHSVSSGGTRGTAPKHATAPPKVAEHHASTTKAAPAAAVALKAQPIRSNSRGGGKLANQRTTLPTAAANQKAANQRTSLPPANQRATSPAAAAANQRATTPTAAAANQRSTSPAAAAANRRATSPAAAAANQRATPQRTGQNTTLPTANHGVASPPGGAVKQQSQTLQPQAARGHPTPRLANGGQQSLSPDGKRESHF